VSEHAKEAWERPGYGDIESAGRSGDDIVVRFANGDLVTVAADDLGLPGGDYHVSGGGESSTALTVRTPAGTREIDWMLVRSAADPAFAQALRDRDAAESRRIGRRIKAVRENSEISQQAAARMVGMTPPQLAKLERGETDMRISTVRALLRAMGATFADISGPDAPELSVKEVRRRAVKAGAPRDIVERIAGAVRWREVPVALARAFGWDRDALLDAAAGPPRLAVRVRFKSASRDKRQESPLLPVARTVSELAAPLHRTPPRPLPRDPHALRRAILAEHGEMTLDALLASVWDAGVVVVPMIGRGGFQAAVWEVADRPVIVLKESRDLPVYWLFDLAHEAGHLALGHVAAEGLVDVDAPTAPDAGDQDERDANAYALDVLLPGHQQLLAEVREDAAGDYMRFKFAVQRVAARAGAAPELLGVVAAYEMTEVGEPKDRWGSAQNLAPRGSGRATAERHFFERLPLDELAPLDAALVRAVTRREP